MKTTKRTNASLSTEEQTDIKNLMERGVSRKTAIRKLRANQKAAAKLREQAEKNTPDFKSAAANDKPEVAKPEPMTKADVGAARSEGIRLYKLAGRPTKQHFIAVYGPKSAKMTWAAQVTFA